MRVAAPARQKIKIFENSTTALPIVTVGNGGIGPEMDIMSDDSSISSAIKNTRSNSLTEVFALG